MKRQRASGKKAPGSRGWVIETMQTPIVLLLISALVAPVLLSQPAKPVQWQSQSTFRSVPEKDGSRSVEINNSWFEITGAGIPGLPFDQRLLLRKTVQSKETVGDIGVDAFVTLEAWRFGDDQRQKPLYTIRV